MMSQNKKILKINAYMAKFSGIDFSVCFPLLNPRRVHELTLLVKSVTIAIRKKWKYDYDDNIDKSLHVFQNKKNKSFAQ